MPLTQFATATEVELCGTVFDQIPISLQYGPDSEYVLQILSCGAGMQSTALALMACEKKMLLDRNPLAKDPYPDVPIYDLIVYCDLGYEPAWVYEQVKFIADACKKAGIFFKVLDEMLLYEDYVNYFGFDSVKSIPFYSVAPDGKKGMQMRACTPEYKVKMIEKFVRTHFLKYEPGQRMKKTMKGKIAMHIGFSYEEKKRKNESKSPLFVNTYPLIEMQLERPENYKYNLEKWGLETKASACLICPYHRNYFFQYLKENYPDDYKAVVHMDSILDLRRPLSAFKSELYISNKRKRIIDLSPEDCDDAQTFLYNGQPVWNGF